MSKVKYFTIINIFNKGKIHSSMLITQIFTCLYLTPLSADNYLTISASGLLPFKVYNGLRIVRLITCR